MIQFPGPLRSFEPATGLLVRGINVNGKYLLVNSCNIMPKQDTKMAWYLQGGARAAIADIGTREITGSIEFPLRVLDDGTLEGGAVEILKNAENPDRALVIDTNHTLTTANIVADCGGTDFNHLLSLDCLVVQSLDIVASARQKVRVSASITGTLTDRTASTYVAPSQDAILGRELSFADCNAGRLQSSMSNVDEIKITVSNDVSKTTFIVPYTNPETRFDMPQYIMTYNHKWGGSFEEILRRGIEQGSYIHGGIMQGENLILEFGPLTATIAVPVFQVSEQPYSPDLIKRKTEFFSQNWPRLHDPDGDLFRLDSNTSNCHRQL